jgi:hypothetical protein
VLLAKGKRSFENSSEEKVGDVLFHNNDSDREQNTAITLGVAGLGGGMHRPQLQKTGREKRNSIEKGNLKYASCERCNKFPLSAERSSVISIAKCRVQWGFPLWSKKAKRNHVHEFFTGASGFVFAPKRKHTSKASEKHAGGQFAAHLLSRASHRRSTWNTTKMAADQDAQELVRLFKDFLDADVGFLYFARSDGCGGHACSPVTQRTLPTATFHA